MAMRFQSYMKLRGGEDERHSSGHKCTSEPQVVAAMGKLGIKLWRWWKWKRIVTKTMSKEHQLSAVVNHLILPSSR